MLFDVSNASDQALEAYEKGLGLREALWRADPDNRRYRTDLARSYGFLGDVQLNLGRLAQADLSYWESHHLREKLAADHDPEAEFQLARSWSNFASYQIRVRALATAVFFYDKARELQEGLVKAYPAVTDYQTDLGNCYVHLADLKWMQSGEAAAEPARQGLVAEAAAQVEKARGLFQGLLKSDPAGVSGRAGMAECHLLLAKLNVTANPNDTATHLNQARALLEKLRQQRITALEQVSYAQVLAMQLELAPAPPAAGDPRRQEVLQLLKEAIAKGYRNKHPRDLERDRAFQVLRADDDFKQCLRQYLASYFPAN
jgi:tetratricopeptide (TPR) repeat protein